MGKIALSSLYIYDMKRWIGGLLLLILVSSCGEPTKKEDNKTATQTREKYAVDTSSFKEVLNVPTVNYEGLDPLLHKDDNKIYVVNFWATWCLPCVKELPYFEYLGQQYKNSNVEVILVSLDFPNQKTTRLLPYINKKKLLSKVIHLDDPNEQVWIAKVSEDWSGAIPATLIYSRYDRKFFEKSFSYDELVKELKQFIP